VRSIDIGEGRGPSGPLRQILFTVMFGMHVDYDGVFACATRTNTTGGASQNLVCLISKNEELKYISPSLAQIAS
jgi:hypothetical protein